jgi:hypothetical protein
MVVDSEPTARAKLALVCDPTVTGCEAIWSVEKPFLLTVMT